jgi:DNA-binding NarL/FixJ family response regulator
VNPQTVAVAHRAGMVAEGIAAALSAYPGLAPIAVATTSRELEQRAERADAVALDRHLPGAKTIAGRLHRKGVRVVFLGESEGEDDGVSIPMGASIASLAAALAPNGGRVWPGSAGPLTRRQKEVLALISRGLAAKQVARYLGISPKTVERHKTQLFAKLGVSNQTAAVHRALTKGSGGIQPWMQSSL